MTKKNKNTIIDMKVKKLIKFDSGATRDTNELKGSYELISPFAMKRLALVYQKGGIQKGDRNWEKGFPMSRALQSALRHIYQYIEGYRDEDHLAHASWNLFAAIHFEEMIKKGKLSKKINDLPNYNV